MTANDSSFHRTNIMAEQYSENIIKRALETGRITKDDEAFIREHVAEISATSTSARAG